MAKIWKNEDERKRFFARWINRPVRYSFYGRHKWKRYMRNYGEWEKWVQIGRAAKQIGE